MPVDFKILADKQIFISQASNDLIFQICSLQEQDKKKIVKIGLSGGILIKYLFQKVPHRVPFMSK